MRVLLEWNPWIKRPDDNVKIKNADLNSSFEVQHTIYTQ